MMSSSSETVLSFYNWVNNDWESMPISQAKGWDYETAKQYISQTVEAQEAYDKFYRLGTRPYAAVLMVLANGGK